MLKQVPKNVGLGLLLLFVMVSTKTIRLLALIFLARLNCASVIDFSYFEQLLDGGSCVTSHAGLSDFKGKDGARFSTLHRVMLTMTYFINSGDRAMTFSNSA